MYFLFMQMQYGKKNLFSACVATPTEDVVFEILDLAQHVIWIAVDSTWPFFFFHALNLKSSRTTAKKIRTKPLSIGIPQE